MRGECYSSCRHAGVCASVTQHLTSRICDRAIKQRAYSVAYDCQKCCVDFSEMTASKSYGMKNKQKCQYANKIYPTLAYPRSVFPVRCRAKHHRLLHEGVETCVLLPAVHHRLLVIARSLREAEFKFYACITSLFVPGICTFVHSLLLAIIPCLQRNLW